jgi:NADPH2 dehydrogenase
MLKDVGIDLIDARGGALVPGVRIRSRPGYQVPFAETIRREVQIADRRGRPDHGAATSEEILQRGRPTPCLLARAMLR